MSAIEQLEDLEHRVVVLEREVQVLKSRLRDGTIGKSLNGVDVVRGSAKSSQDDIVDPEYTRVDASEPNAAALAAH